MTGDVAAAGMPQDASAFRVRIDPRKTRLKHKSFEGQRRWSRSNHIQLSIIRTHHKMESITDVLRSLPSYRENTFEGKWVRVVKLGFDHADFIDAQRGQFKPAGGVVDRLRSLSEEGKVIVIVLTKVRAGVLVETSMECQDVCFINSGEILRNGGIQPVHKAVNVYMRNLATPSARTTGARVDEVPYLITLHRDGGFTEAECAAWKVQYGTNEVVTLGDGSVWRGGVDPTKTILFAELYDTPGDLVANALSLWNISLKGSDLKLESWRAGMVGLGRLMAAHVRNPVLSTIPQSPSTPTAEGSNQPQ